MTKSILLSWWGLYHIILHLCARVWVHMHAYVWRGGMWVWPTCFFEHSVEEIEQADGESGKQTVHTAKEGSAPGQQLEKANKIIIIIITDSYLLWHQLKSFSLNYVHVGMSTQQVQAEAGINAQEDYLSTENGSKERQEDTRCMIHSIQWCNRCGILIFFPEGSLLVQKQLRLVTKKLKVYSKRCFMKSAFQCKKVVVEQSCRGGSRGGVCGVATPPNSSFN